jgi:beta-glucosidase-like glycosyl hydrolase
MELARTVADLMGDMSLAERVAQLCCFDPSGRFAVGSLDLPSVAELAPLGIGHAYVSADLGLDEETLRSRVAELGDALRERSPHGIPPLIHAEALNGIVHPAGTQFPTPLALAASWQPSMVEAMADVTRAELRSLGITHALSPNLDITRDPRWGRVHETYGEDPELAAAMGVAFVRGLQGRDLAAGVAATAKHFVGYGASQGGLNHGAVSLGARSLREEYARPFEWAVRQAGLSAVMVSYAELDGLPSTADANALNGLLRSRIGFDGIVVSDYFSIAMLNSLHGVAGDFAAAAGMALVAGVDVEYPRPDCYSELVQLVQRGVIPEATVDTAVSRVLRLKYRLGLLSSGVRPPAPTRPAAERNPRLLSRRIADSGLVLLTHDGTLPIGPHHRRIAVVGSLASSTRIHYAAYTAPAFTEFTLNDLSDVQTTYIGALLRAHGRAVADEEAVVEANAKKLDPLAGSIVEQLRERLSDVDLVELPLGGPSGVASDAELASLARTVSSADLALVVLGERTGWSGALPTAGEGRDRQSLSLPGDQAELATAVIGTGVPTVVVLVSGRPLDIDAIVARGATVLFAPLLATAGPHAIVSALLGETVPAGRLPISWPRSAGQIPVFARARAGSGYEHPVQPVPGYIDGRPDPLFAFGHGKSYTTFSYDRIEAEPKADVAGALHVTVHVSNVGDYDAEEVVQLYARDVLAPVTRPVHQLIAFARHPITRGATVEFQFDVPADVLAFADVDSRLRMEPGVIEISCGPSSAHRPLRTMVELTGDPVDVDRTAGRVGFSVRTASPVRQPAGPGY